MNEDASALGNEPSRFDAAAALRPRLAGHEYPRGAARLTAMDPAVTTGIFTIAGGVVTYGLTTISQRSDSHRAERQRANDLLIQVVRGIGTLQIERAVFAERRNSWRPNFLAAGAVLMHLAAGHFEGNWIRGAANGIDGIAAWDSAEGARFTDRFQPAVLEVSTALVQLSLMSSGLQKSAAQVNQALGAAMKARKKPDADAADKQMTEAIASLRASVTELTARKRWRPRRRLSSANSRAISSWSSANS
jgi:hypothetical protein